MSVRVELFHAPHCPRCGRARALLRELVVELGTPVDYRERDVVAALEDAARLGILTTPAIVIDGRLAFSGLPARETLRATLEAAARAADRDTP